MKQTCVSLYTEKRQERQQSNIIKKDVIFDHGFCSAGDKGLLEYREVAPEQPQEHYSRSRKERHAGIQSLARELYFT